MPNCGPARTGMHGCVARLVETGISMVQRTIVLILKGKRVAITSAGCVRALHLISLWVKMVQRAVLVVDQFWLGATMGFCKTDI